MAISNVFLKKKIVCLSVCLTFFESADAPDLGPMTLFLLVAIAFVVACYATLALHPALSVGRSVPLLLFCRF